MKLEGIVPISHESIYRRLWSDKKAGGDLHTNLRHKIRSYRRPPQAPTPNGLISHSFN